MTVRHPRTYTARVAFHPTVFTEAPTLQKTPRLGAPNMAGDLRSTTAIDYFVDLAESRTVLNAVVTELADSQLTPNPKDPIAVDAAVKELTDDITTSSDPRTGIVRLFVRTSSPILSRNVAASVVIEMDELTRRLRSIEANDERTFLDKRRVTLDADLRQAEAALQDFQERNRGLSKAAGLALEQTRLEREITLQRTNLFALERERFNAELKSARNVPSIGIIEPAEIPTLPDSRRLGTNLAFGAVLGLTLGLYIAFGKQSFTDKMRATPTASHRP
jgi:uncharacterized protein involved in exopolysaccharide biosynthesis